MPYNVLGMFSAIINHKIKYITMKELQELIKRVEVEINKTPTGELRNLLCDANIMLQQQALNIPVVSGSFTADDVERAYDDGYQTEGEVSFDIENYR